MGTTVRWEDREDAWVTVGDRELPAAFELEHRPPKGTGEPAWAATFEVINGTPQCRRIVLASTDTGREVRTADLRRLNVDELLEGASTQLATRRVTDESGQTYREHDLGDWQLVAKAVRSARMGAPRKVTDERLRQVADVYRANVGSDPTDAVARHLGVADRTARLWVKRARDAGFLER